MKFVTRLARASKINNSLLCVGLDADIEKIPQQFRRGKRPLFSFNAHVVDATADLVCAYKPNAAFYESTGRTGELRDTIRYIQKHAPHVPVILDAKRGDIGNTAAHYARSCFEYLDADAVTLSPYMGFDSLEPFARYREKGLFILCLTSNPGSSDFQQKKCGTGKLYELVADAADQWNRNHGNMGLVVGATRPEELLRLRKSHPRLMFLVPGLGTQGGDLEKSVRYGTLNKGVCIFNVSRQVLYPCEGSIRDTALALRNAMQKFVWKKKQK